MSRLSPLTALVTGSSRGIGRAVASALADAGAKVVGLSRSGGDAPGVIGVRADLLASNGVETAVQRIHEALGGTPDLLVNNAGTFVVAPIASTTPETFDRMVALNLSVPYRLVFAFLDAMRARGRGHIVTIGSIADHIAFAGNAAYAASKFGLRGLHEVLRGEITGSGVRGTLISPGAVDTELWDSLDAATRATFPQGADMLSATDVADAVMFAVTRPERVNVDEIRLSRS